MNLKTVVTDIHEVNDVADIDWALSVDDAYIDLTTIMFITCLSDKTILL